jgi:hypothetical protein
MNTDKSIVLKAFNKVFFEFLDDIITIYPENVEMMTAKDSATTFKKLNPTSIIKVWYSSIYCQYRGQIDSGNIDFFTDKDYSSDLSDISDMKAVLNMIENVRDPIRNMSAENKKHVTKYIQDLSKLSTAYATLMSA